MGCKIGLALGALKKPETPFEFEVSPETGHYFGFFKSSTPSSRTPERGSFIWVYQPEENKFKELIAAYREKDEHAKTFWPVVLGISDDYKCLGFCETPKEDTKTGTCGKCPYSIADKQPDDAK